MLFLACLRRAALAGVGCLSLFSVAAQVPDTTAWTQFSRPAKGENHYGYQDASGRVRLAPKFGMFTNARRFRHIMAVSEAATHQQYYLLKNGRAVGRDSVYMSGDYEVACESETYILFRDRQKDRVGFFNSLGKPVIPALYNYATPFYNGLAVALVGATRSCWGGGDTLRCEHLGWAGGRQVLLNQRNEVVADLPATLPTDALNWYSLRRNAPAPDTATTRTLTAANGDRLTFTDYRKEFRQWFFGPFAAAVRSGQVPAVAALCFREVTTAGRPFRGWSKSSRATFVAKFQPVLHERLAAIRPDTPGLNIFDTALNALEYPAPAYRLFWTDCGEHFKEKYPVFEVVLTYPARPADAPVTHQEHFEFIRTAAGYQLLSVAL